MTRTRKRARCRERGVRGVRLVFHGWSRRHHQGLGHLGSARLRCSLGCGGAVVAMAWRPSSLVVVACSADGCVHAWDARDGASLLQLRGHSDAPLCLATAWAQDAIVTAGDDRTVRVFRVPPLRICRGRRPGLRRRRRLLLGRRSVP